MSDEFDWRGARALANRYACSGHDATMDLFVTDENAADTADDSLGWDDIHRGVLRLHRVHGDHLSIVTEPDVVALANLVTECLRQARSMHELLVS
jgi:thioesterase domain-containing protein